MIRIVDRLNDQVVQKVVSPKGETLRYQYGVPGQGMTEVSSLVEARVAIGRMPPVVLLDLPRLSMPSNA